MRNNFRWILLRCVFFSCIVVINISLIDTSTWLCISFFLKRNKLIWWMFGMNVDIRNVSRNVWILYNIITVVCIQIILFTTFYIWGNSSTSLIIRIEWNLPRLFSSWWCKHHDYLFYFCEIVPKHNQNKTWHLIGSSMSWESIIDWSDENYNNWFNYISRQNLKNCLRTNANSLKYPNTYVILHNKYWRAIFFPKLRP